jgi:hypothetical protein
MSFEVFVLFHRKTKQKIKRQQNMFLQYNKSLEALAALGAAFLVPPRNFLLGSPNLFTRPSEG